MKKPGASSFCSSDSFFFCYKTRPHWGPTLPWARMTDSIGTIASCESLGHWVTSLLFYSHEINDTLCLCPHRLRHCPKNVMPILAHRPGRFGLLNPVLVVILG